MAERKTIYLDDALEAIRKLPNAGIHWFVSAEAVFNVLLKLPSAYQERKKGKWTKGSDMPPMKHRNGKPKKFKPSWQYCSACGHEAFDDSDWGEQLFDWCPYCGADMRGDKE